jgi:hypothetical protein
MASCEANSVQYVFGMARNVRLEKIVAEALEQARQQFERTGQAARVFIEFEHETVSGSWSRSRRVVGKAEHIDGKSNPRFIVTSLPAETWRLRNVLMPSVRVRHPLLQLIASLYETLRSP